jgi:hypothetical protein
VPAPGVRADTPVGDVEVAVPEVTPSIPQVELPAVELPAVDDVTGALPDALPDTLP